MLRLQVYIRSQLYDEASALICLFQRMAADTLAPLLQRAIPEVLHYSVKEQDGDAEEEIAFPMVYVFIMRSQPSCGKHCNPSQGSPANIVDEECYYG